MPNLEKSILACALSIGLCAVQAQQAVRITDPAAIIADAGVLHRPAAMEAMKGAALTDDLMNAALECSNPAVWPEGWRNDSLRSASGQEIAKAMAYRICSFEWQEEKVTLVQVPALQNAHLPQVLRDKKDIFLVLKESGLGDPPRIAKEKPSMGPTWVNMPKARINKPEQIYATYDLARDENALRTLAQSGLSQAEIQAVIFRSHERNWPDGIDRFEKRREQRKLLRKYKTYLAAKWDDKVLLVVPADQNKDLPPGLRPYMDIYMVYTGPAVAVAGK